MMRSSLLLCTLVPPLQPEQCEGVDESERRIMGRSARFMALPVVLLACALTLWGSAPVLAASSNKGLPPGAVVPAWAAGNDIHFFASRNASSVLSSRRSESIIPDLGRRCETGYCPEPPLLYHGGKGVQHSPAVHLIFWGSNWTKAPGAELKTQLLKMYEGLSGSAWQGILAQYFDATGRVSSTVTVTSYVDAGVGAPTSVNSAKIKEEVASAVKAASWTREFSSQFVVIPAPGSTYESSFDTGFCGYHGVDGSGSSYTFYPYIGEEPFRHGCIGFDPHENADNVTSMVASHEYAESATDPQVEPFPNAEWYTSNEYEIGDICASGDSELPNGAWVQGLWDDHQSACSLSDSAPPHVYAITEPATGVKATAGQLNGTVNPEGLETTYHFEYGTTTSYGTKVPVPDAKVGSGTSNQTVSQSITGLQMEATYHYRLVATNSTGTTDGEDHVFVTTRWSIQTTPHPTGSEASELGGVSCTSASACTVVGLNDEALGYKSLAERWNGTAWSIQTTPSPQGYVSKLQGVSCSSSTACTAVGWDSYKGGGNSALAEHWNGTEWSLQTIAAPKAEFSELTSVSCTSSTACTAVGMYGYPLTMFAERWNGTEWSIQATPGPTGAKQTRLYGVACTSSSACTAVGTYESSIGFYGALVEYWNGTAWSQQATTIPTGARSSYLGGVSCTLSTACTAVGNYENSAKTVVTLAERWNGTEWSFQTTRTPAGAKGASELLGVSCSSSAVCTATGRYTTSSPGAPPPRTTVTLAEHWNGTEWSIQETANPIIGLNGLSGVSCTLPEACVAVGSSQMSRGPVTMLAERFAPPVAETEAATSVAEAGATLNGTLNPQSQETTYHFEYGKTTSYGTSVPIPDANAGAGASNVKVSKAITGLELETTYHFRLVATNGSGTTIGADRVFTTTSHLPSWRITPTPNPSGARDGYLWGVSCVSSTACTAVGIYQGETSNIYTDLAEHWNGTEWALQSVPAPTGAKESYLYGVACTASNACTAAGIYDNSSGTYVTLAEFWNGTEWKVQSTPNPTGSLGGGLFAVSCTSSTACTAVGEYENSSKTLVTSAERWNGTEWSIQTTPNPTGAIESGLSGVSCTSSTACTAVGTYKNGSGAHASFAESWNGTEWSIQSLPNPTGATASQTRGVSCTSSTACTAVGTYTNSSGAEEALAERWNGTAWSVQTTAEPSGTKANHLDGVSCISSTICTANGVSLTTSGKSVTLAERWNGTEWAVQTTPNGEQGQGWLSGGISCSSSTSCAAVGNTGTTLAEIYS